MQIAKVNKNIEIDSVELPVFDLDSGLEKNSFATSVTVTCFLCNSFFQDNCQCVISYDSIECNVIVILDLQCTSSKYEQSAVLPTCIHLGNSSLCPWRQFA